jgi:diguanylate cyclase (GGDEF)-like protein
VANSAQPDDSAAGAYAPYAQLVRMLLPSARSVAIYDHDAELLWCSDGYERPDLRALLEQQRASETVASRGRVESTSAGVPVFISALRAADARPLGSVVVELGGGNGSRSIPSMVVSMLRPVLDCLERRLDLEHTAIAADRSEGLELLLGVDEDGRDDPSALQALLRQCVRELECSTGALVVPDKNLELACADDGSQARTLILDRTQKHLLAWAQLNKRPMVVNRGAGGAEAPYKILSCPLRDTNDRITGVVALFRGGAAADFEARDVRILEFVARKAAAILQSEHDALTGLTNRLIFERRAQRLLDETSAALIYVDIDKLAAINEAFGLAAGDEVIQRVAALVQRAAGAPALVTRLGGDRFAALLPQRDVAAATSVGAHIQTATAQLGYLHGSDALPISVCVGVTASGPDEQLQHLLAAAELACKRAKRAGVGRIEVIEDLRTLSSGTLRQSLAASALEDALRSNQFELDAQPIVDLRGGSADIVGYEMLVRLRGANGEVIAPEKFLDACARYELTPALDRWTLCALVELLRPHAALLASSPLTFSLNVSAQSIESRKYAAFALDTLAGAGLAPRSFCFEIKEAAAVANLAAAEAFIRDMLKAGAKVALDDFGSGLSSLAHLKQLPVSFLKIDGRFVRRVLADRVAESIVAAIAGAARTLGVTTIAEHVECAEVAARLAELDVALGQGFHLGRPLPAADALERAVEAATPAALRGGRPQGITAT